MSFEENQPSEQQESGNQIVENKIGELDPRSRNLNMTVKVMSKTPIREIISRMDASTHRVAEALVGDETGSILMTLWDDNIDRLNEGETIKIKNGYVSLFRGSMRLNTGRYGSFEQTDGTIENVNTDNNMSEKQFEQERRFQPRRFGDRGDRGRRSGFKRRY